jgi:hypothetical protein
VVVLLLLMRSTRPGKREEEGELREGSTLLKREEGQRRSHWIRSAVGSF